MTTAAATTIKLPLDELAHRVDAMLKRSEDMRVSAGCLLLEAKQRVAAGEAGAGVTWRAWVAANVRRSHRDVNRLLALVRADDPAAAAARERGRSGSSGGRPWRRCGRGSWRSARRTGARSPGGCSTTSAARSTTRPSGRRPTPMR